MSTANTPQFRRATPNRSKTPSDFYNETNKQTPARGSSPNVITHPRSQRFRSPSNPNELEISSARSIGKLTEISDTPENSDILTLRKNIAEEFYSTEYSYVSYLNTVYENFIKPLKDDEANSNKPILSRNEQLILFSNWEVILNCHRTILEKLEPRIKNWDQNQKIGDIFNIKNTGFIKLYKYYVNNFDKATSLLAYYKQQKNSNFKIFCFEAEQICEGKKKLESYLIMPVQRIPRYLLLLQDLIKNTHESHVDYADLVQAHAQMKAFAEFINESKKNAEQTDRVKDLYSRIEGLPEDIIFTVGVGVVKYGILWEIQKKDKKSKKCFIVLVNTHLIVASIKDEKKPLFKLRTLISLNDIKATLETEDDLCILIECTNSFIKDSELGNEVPIYRLAHEDPQNTNKWYFALMKVISKSETNKKPKVNLNFKSELDKTKLRLKILKDFIKKETVYLFHLKLLKQFLSSSTYPLSMILVVPTTTLTITHSNLVDNLWQRMVAFSSQTHVGDTFLASLDGFQSYEQFCLIWYSDTTPSLLKKNEFMDQIKKFELEHHVSFIEICEIISQRIFNISFIVSELAQNLPNEHEDLQTLRIVSVKLEQLKANIKVKQKKKRTLISSLTTKNT